MKKLYTNTSFKGVWPVGTSAIVCAESPEEAAVILNNALENAHLPQTRAVTSADMYIFELTIGHVEILQNGDY